MYFGIQKDYIKGAFFQLDQPRLVVSINIHVRHIGTFIFYYKCQLKYLRLGHRDFKTPGKKLLWISVLIIPFQARYVKRLPLIAGFMRFCIRNYLELSRTARFNKYVDTSIHELRFQSWDWLQHLKFSELSMILCFISILIKFC